MSDIVEWLQNWVNGAGRGPIALTRRELTTLMCEIERLRQQWAEVCKDYGELRAERDEIQAALEGTKEREDRLAERAARAETERERLRADIDFHLNIIGALTTTRDELRAALRAAAPHIEFLYARNPSNQYVSDALILVRRALEGKE